MTTMKRLPSMLLAAALSCACSVNHGHARHERIDIATVASDDTVWICTSEGAKRFHASDTCGGILSCGEEIIPVTRDEAEYMDRSFCHKCYRK